jgi:hypothetical protein
MFFSVLCELDYSIFSLFLLYLYIFRFAMKSKFWDSVIVHSNNLFLLVVIHSLIYWINMWFLQYISSFISLVYFLTLLKNSISTICIILTFVFILTKVSLLYKSVGSDVTYKETQKDRKFWLLLPLSLCYLYIVYCDILKSPNTYFFFFISLAILLEYALNTSFFGSHLCTLVTNISETWPRKFYKINFIIWC